MNDGGQEGARERSYLAKGDKMVFELKFHWSTLLLSLLFLLFFMWINGLGRVCLNVLALG